jgi:hypothetical protein
MKILSGKTAAFFRVCTFSLSLFFLLAPSLISANVLVDTLKPSASNTGSIFLGTAKDFLPQVVDPTVLLITTPFRNITSVVKGESNLASISSVWNSFLDIFRPEDEVAPTNTTTIIRNIQPGTNTIVRETTVTGDTSFIERQIATLTARVNSLGGNTTSPVVNNNTYVTYSSSPSSAGVSIGDGSFSGITAGISNQISEVRSDLTSSIAGIDLTNFSDITVNGGITLNDITPPATTTDLLYNDLGDLYWAGNLIAGGAVGTWTSNGTDVYRTSGNVGMGTTTPSQLLTIGDNAYITSSGDALFAGTTTMGSIDAYGGGGLSIDVVNRILYANDGTTPQLDWSSAGTFNLSNGTSLSTAGGDLFFNAAGGHSVVSNSPFNAYQGIVDGSSIVSIDSNTRTLNDTSGNAVVSWGDGTYALNATGNSNFTGDIYGGGYGYFSSGLLVNELSPYDNSAYFEVNGKGGFNDGVSSVYFVDATYAINATGNSYFNGDMGVGMTPVSARLSVNYNNVYVRLGDGTNIAGVFEDGTNTVNIADGTYAINATGPIKSLTAGGNVFGAFGESGYGVAGTRTSGGGSAAAYFDDGGASSIVTIADGTYAINATGKNQFISGAKNILFDPAAFGYASGADSIASFYGTGYKSVDLATINSAVYAYDGSNTAILADGTYAINATGNILVSGDVTGANVFSANYDLETLGGASDSRFKTNVTSLASTTLDKILALNPVTYNWNQTYLDMYPDTYDASGTKLGFIAQDVEQVFPEVVTHRKDGFFSIDYGKLTAALTQGMKEMYTVLNDLKDRIQSIAAWFGGDGSKLTIQNEVCVDEVCVTKEEFKQMLLNAQNEQEATSNSSNENSEDNSVSDDADMVDDTVSSTPGTDSSSEADATLIEDAVPVEEIATSSEEVIVPPAEEVVAPETPASDPIVETVPTP